MLYNAHPMTEESHKANRSPLDNAIDECRRFGPRFWRDDRKARSIQNQMRRALGENTIDENPLSIENHALVGHLRRSAASFIRIHEGPLIAASGAITVLAQQKMPQINYSSTELLFRELLDNLREVGISGEPLSILLGCRLLKNRRVADTHFNKLLQEATRSNSTVLKAYIANAQHDFCDLRKIWDRIRTNAHETGIL